MSKACLPVSLTELTEHLGSMRDAVFKIKTRQDNTHQTNKQQQNKTWKEIHTHFQPLAFRHLHVYEHVCLHATHTHKYEPLSQGHLCLPWKHGGVLAL